MSIEFEARAARSKLWPFRESRLGGKLVERGLGFIEGYVAGASREVTDEQIAQVRAEARRGALIEAAVLVEWFSDRNPDVYEAAAMNGAADHIRALADKEQGNE